MTDTPFSYEDYEKTLEQLVTKIHSKLTEKDRLFLMSFKEGIPDWEKFIVRNAKELPAINWKLQSESEHSRSFFSRLALTLYLLFELI